MSEVQKSIQKVMLRMPILILIHNFFLLRFQLKKTLQFTSIVKWEPRAEFAASVLKERGYTKVTNLGGLDDMEALGFEFEE